MFYRMMKVKMTCDPSMDSIMAEDQGHIFYIIPSGNHYFKKKTKKILALLFKN